MQVEVNEMLIINILLSCCTIVWKFDCFKFKSDYAVRKKHSEVSKLYSPCIS